MWKSIRKIMSSLRIKIVISLIGMSIFSVMLGGYSSRLILSDRFQIVVTERSTAEFSRDVLGYYRNHGSSLERAYNEESWDHHIAVLNQTRQQPQDPAAELNSAHFIATDEAGNVWVPNGHYQIGDMVPPSELEKAIPIIDLGNTIGYVVVDGSLNLSGTEAQYLTDLSNSLWLSALLVALLAIPLGIMLGKHLTNPINSLNSAIRSMRPQTMYQSVPITSNDEIGLLTQSFNQMSEELASFLEVTERQKQKIEETESMRREGLVSISHELRTPLYRLVSQAYAMLDGIRPLDRAELTKLAESLDHLSELVNDLHQLALSDVQAFSCNLELTDFALIVSKALESRREAFAKKDLKLITSLPENLMLDADPTRLRQIVENLLSNCIRYTNVGGEIKINLSRSEKYTELVVSDNGPGVPAKSMDLLFDRFYRGESSRSRATGGAGLGLSLIKTYAEMHGGKVSAFASNEGGLGIRVQLPNHLA